MAQANTEEFNLSAGAGNGDMLPCERYTFKSVHIRPGGGAPDYDLQMTFDGTNWVDHTTGISTDTVITTEDPGANPLPKAIRGLRIVTATAGTGTPAAVLFGHDPA